MKKEILLLFLLVFMFSCNQNKTTEESLKKESFSFFKKNKIDTVDFKKRYYIKENKSIGYTHYILKYYKMIGKDSVIVWFTRDDEADYSIQTNDNFDKYYRSKDTIN